MDKRVYLGIDTSNYTTSLAVIGDDGGLLADQRMPLHVAKEQQGLRQSEALFQHVKHLPQLMENLPWQSEAWTLAAIGVSGAPRPMAQSYMPVFLAGLGMARSLASLQGVPLVTTTHQENHLWAALHSAGGPSASGFAALHISGGTSDILKVERQQQRVLLQTMGTSDDLHAGQMIDRVGVALGLEFPAGPALERVAADSVGDLRLPSAVQNGAMSFSGPCTQALRLVGQESAADIARAVLLCVARTLEKALRWYFEKFGIHPVLASGGVMANQLIRQELRRRLPHATLWYAEPKFSVDNGLGAAVTAWNSNTNRPWEDLLFRT